MTLQATRDLLESEKVWCVAAHVAKHDGEDEFWERSTEGVVIVSVRTNSSDTQIKAALKGGGDSGVGVWFIPNEGTEVVIAFSDGEFEGDAYIVGIFGDSPRAPGGPLGGQLQPNIVLVIGTAVEIRTLGGVAQSLAFKSDVEAVDEKYANHLHANESAGPTSTIIPNPTPPYTPPFLPGLPLAGAGIVGTSVLKGE